MTFMIVASPCAVVLATMPPLLAAMATAGRNGVLVKSAVVMEQLGSVTAVAFDKTGTLTQGTPRLTDIWALDKARHDTETILAWAAAAEHPSEHPLARSIVAAATDRRLILPTVEEFDSAPGRGVRATINGHTIEVGSPAIPAARRRYLDPNGRHRGRTWKPPARPWSSSSWTASLPACWPWPTSCASEPPIPSPS